ncbi:SCO1860 family LAETG-anchored protein [Streptomyces sp. NBRC 110028]|uniref:SCO1860 family LAETG-anchored protein n=1 Tax=Streptomyces sp. NBRC 110028 TaxID=1621260 RepID=UPI0006E2527A|nr:SCO1860 family LAETG-anchored protein [Streptomyces sp. NBRC 110028]
MPARRLVAVSGVCAVSVLGVLPAATAQARTGNTAGKASAAVLRTDLSVSLLNKTVTAPLVTSLNEVQAPRTASKTALSATVAGVNGDRPFSVLRADVATARAATDAARSEGYSNLVNAKVNVPGLLSVPLITVEQVTSKAVCAAGKKPTADSNVLGTVSVLGKKATLTAGASTKVDVPSLGQVSLDLSRTATTSRTAAATALALKVSVNPLKLNVSEVEGQVTLAHATCEAPGVPAKPEKPQVGNQTKSEPKPEHLAETGGSSATPYLVSGGAVLLAAGGGAVILARRRRAAGTRGDA